MTITPVRFALALGALALVQTYGCGSVALGPDGGGDAAAGQGGSFGGPSGGNGGSAAGGHGGATFPGTTGDAGHGGAGHGGAGNGGGGGAGHGGGGATGTAGATGGAGHGGAGTGGGGAGGASCSDLEAQYGEALAPARSCTVGASGQCAAEVSSSLSACFSNCMTYVNDATTLNEIKSRWQQAGCANQGPIACPAIACLQPSMGNCIASDGGGGVCSSAQLGLQ